MLHRELARLKSVLPPLRSKGKQRQRRKRNGIHANPKRRIAFILNVEKYTPGVYKITTTGGQFFTVNCAKPRHGKHGFVILGRVLKVSDGKFPGPECRLEPQVRIHRRNEKPEVIGLWLHIDQGPPFSVKSMTRHRSRVR